MRGTGVVQAAQMCRHGEGRRRWAEGRGHWPRLRHNHQQHPQHCRHRSQEFVCTCGCGRQTLRHFSIAAPTQPPLPERGRSFCCPSTSRCYKPLSHQPSRKHDKNITLVSKSPSAGSASLMRFPTPAGKQPAGQGVCKAAAAGGSRPARLWGCAARCSHCKV